MIRKSLLAGVFSLIIPGLGQMYTGRGERGAIILLAAIFIGNINAIWLSLNGLTSPNTNVFWASSLPRILHDVCAAWSIVFYLWQVVDTYRHAR
jgi:TM2 domain-containing membrane protein YozV